jgi:hypothetical protein
MNEQSAEVRLELGGGLYPPSYNAVPGFHGEIRIPEVSITFKESFCSKHPDEHVGSPVGCSKCADETRHVIRDMFRFPCHLNIDCENIKHTHDCKCHLGHLCEEGCPTYDRLITEQSKDADGAPTEPHPLFQVAAEAANEPMRGIYERLAELEQDNAALKNLVTKILAVLPEGPRNEAMTAAIREKLGISEAVGSAQGVEET